MVARCLQIFLASATFTFVLGQEGDCWLECGNKGGLCLDFCGAGKACCRFGFGDDPAECDKAPGTSRWKHRCVKLNSNALTTVRASSTVTPMSTVPPLGETTVRKKDPCDRPGSDWKDWNQLTREEKDGAMALGWTQTSWTAANVRPASDNKLWVQLTPDEKTGAVALGWNSSSWDCEDFYRRKSDCYSDCGNLSGNCSFCGPGRACCRTAFPEQPPECADAKTGPTHHECVTAAPEVPWPPPNCTNETCALAGGNSSNFSKWWLWLLLLLLLCCLILPPLLWLGGCFEKKGKKKKGSKRRGRGDVEQQDSSIGRITTNRDLEPRMPGREISSGAQSSDPLMLNQEPSAGAGSAFGLIDRNQDGVITRSELQFAQQMMGTQQLTNVIAGAAPASFVSYPSGVQQQLAPPAVTAPPVMVGGMIQPVRSTTPGITSIAGQTVMPQSFQPTVRTVQGGHPVQYITTSVSNVTPRGAQLIR